MYDRSSVLGVSENGKELSCPVTAAFGDCCLLECFGCLLGFLVVASVEEKLLLETVQCLVQSL